jgi:TPR repeat protein
MNYLRLVLVASLCVVTPFTRAQTESPLTLTQAEDALTQAKAQAKVDLANVIDCRKTSGAERASCNRQASAQIAAINKRLSDAQKVVASLQSGQSRKTDGAARTNSETQGTNAQGASAPSSSAGSSGALQHPVPSSTVAPTPATPAGAQDARSTSSPAPGDPAFKTLARSCSSGGGSVCFTVGTALAANPRTQTDALSAFGKGCMTGDGESCMKAGMMIEAGLGVTADKHSARLDYIKACKLGDEDGCKRLKTDDDAAKAGQLAMVLAGCRAGHWLDCARVADYAPVDSPEVLEADLKGCKLDNRDSCAAAAHYYQQYSKEPNHSTLAVTYYKMACDQGEMDSCVKLGSGDLGAAGAAAKASVFESNQKQCRAGDAAACNFLGIAAASGKGAPLDAAKAFQYFDQGCKLGNKTSCDNNADTYRKNATQAALTDPTRKIGTPLLHADQLCLHDEKHDIRYVKDTICIKTRVFPDGSSECLSSQAVEGIRTETSVTNTCKRPVSFQEYCNDDKPKRATLLTDEVFIRSENLQCHIAY